MKKLLLALTICVSTAGFAQVLNVASVEKLNIPADANKTIVGISPKGDYVLFSTVQNVGLTKYDLQNGETTVVTTAPGAGFGAKISEDGTSVVYRETSLSPNHLKKVSLKTKNLSTGEVKTIISETRDLQGVSLDGNTVVAINKGKKSTKSLTSAKAQTEKPVLSINNRALIITKNGKTRVFSPNGSQYSYIWPSVSPDGTKALYYICGIGAFVCDINGSNVKNIGKIRAPKWYNNNVVIGMNDIDNGEFVTSSSIIAYSLDGNKQTLTKESEIAMFPYVSADGSKIVCSSPMGEAFIININVK